MTTEHVKGLISKATDALISELDAGRGEHLQRYLATMARFHRYSVSNSILIWLQRPTATHVAGYGTWKKLGRQVRKGERGISILAPVRKRMPKDAEPTDEEDEVVVAFRPAHVFDIEQSNGEPLVAFAAAKGDPGAYEHRLREFLTARGITIEYAKLPGTVQGMSTGGRVVMRDDLAPAERFSTTVHELAHELLNHAREPEKRTKTVRETEAEAVAYVVSEAIGLDCTAAAGDYIKLYDGNKQTLLESLERIRRVATEIIEAVLDEGGLAASQSSEPQDSPQASLAA